MLESVYKRCFVESNELKDYLNAQLARPDTKNAAVVEGERRCVPVSGNDGQRLLGQPSYGCPVDVSSLMARIWSNPSAGH